VFFSIFASLIGCCCWIGPQVLRSSLDGGSNGNDDGNGASSKEVRSLLYIFMNNIFSSFEIIEI
jgi:hypothetical protein